VLLIGCIFVFFMMKKKGFVLILVGFLLTCCLTIFRFNSVSLADKNQEIRGVWLTNVDSEVLLSKKNIKQAIDKLVKLNINTIYPTVWQGGYTLYPSKIAKETFGVSIFPEKGLQNRDMLREIIDYGHKKGLRIIPWFEFGFMTNNGSELATSHPNWLTNRVDGTTVKKEGIEERVWLNPFLPEVQNFILQLITEIVSNYDIDGIQFDDHFGLPSEFGYDNFTVSLYQKELKGLSPSNDSQETFWVRWRADKINQFVAKMFTTVKNINSNCLISLSPNPLHFALPAYLQDWFTWERKGYIEEIILQVYRPDIDRFITELERTEVELAKTHIPVAIGILTGLKNNGVSLDQIESQIQETRKRNFAGVSFFFYESIWNWGKESPLIRENTLQRILKS
jgi:uncharacterized lipoprotein YddW (UPF0748 family)